MYVFDPVGIRENMLFYTPGIWHVFPSKITFSHTGSGAFYISDSCNSLCRIKEARWAVNMSCMYK